MPSQKFPFLILITSLFLVACGSAAQIDPLSIGDPEQGRLIFETGGAHELLQKEQYLCARCHSLDGSDGEGPSLQGIAERAGTRVSDLSAEEYIRQSILEPAAYIAGDYNHQMATIHARLLTEEELDNLVAFLLTQ